MVNSINVHHFKEKICQIGNGQVWNIGELRWNDISNKCIRILIHCKQELLKANLATFNGVNTDFTIGSLSRLLLFLVPSGFPFFTKSQVSH